MRTLTIILLLVMQTLTGVAGRAVTIEHHGLSGHEDAVELAAHDHHGDAPSHSEHHEPGHGLLEAVFAVPHCHEAKDECHDHVRQGEAGRDSGQNRVKVPAPVALAALWAAVSLPDEDLGAEAFREPWQVGPPDAHRLVAKTTHLRL